LEVILDFWNGNALRFDLVDRRIGAVKNSGGKIIADIAGEVFA
jgi:hypothetical protein